MLIQPFIENAIEHGFNSECNKIGTINVSFKLEGEYIVVYICDDGIGYLQGQKKTDGFTLFKEKSVSTDLIRDQLAQFSKRFNKKFDLKIIEGNSLKGSAEGTTVIIKIPNIEIE
jgi:LytS/YehU family sensor histidine kinase